MKMGRLHLIEFEDQPWFPRIIREYMTDYLNFSASLNSKPFVGFAKKLKQAMLEQKETQIIDLCSGGAGPLPQIVRILRTQENYPVTATLTDLYPNISAFQRTQLRDKNITHETRSVDATAVPEQLNGFRTLLNSFHHFPPELARRILENAAKNQQGIAVMELVGRSAFGFISVLSLLLFMPLFTPFIRPFRFSRFFFTYIIPAIPLFSMWDGLVSCLRVYSVEELRELTDSISAKGYVWDIGKLPIEGTPGYITYLIGRTGTDSKA